MIHLQTDTKRTKRTVKPRFYIFAGLVIIIIALLIYKYAGMPEQLTTSVYWRGVL